jgi:hypothetical protein
MPSLFCCVCAARATGIKFTSTLLRYSSRCVLRTKSIAGPVTIEECSMERDNGDCDGGQNW